MLHIHIDIHIHKHIYILYIYVQYTPTTLTSGPTDPTSKHTLRPPGASEIARRALHPCRCTCTKGG